MFSNFTKKLIKSYFNFSGCHYVCMASHILTHPIKIYIHFDFKKLHPQFSMSTENWSKNTWFLKHKIMPNSTLYIKNAKYYWRDNIPQVLKSAVLKRHLMFGSFWTKGLKLKIKLCRSQVKKVHKNSKKIGSTCVHTIFLRWLQNILFRLTCILWSKQNSFI